MITCWGTAGTFLSLIYTNLMDPLIHTQNPQTIHTSKSLGRQLFVIIIIYSCSI